MDTLSKIMNLIKEYNLEQKEFASALGIHPDTITNWKAGRSKSYLKYLHQIADYFDVPVSYLVEDKPLTHEKSVTVDRIFKLLNEKDVDEDAFSNLLGLRKNEILHWRLGASKSYLKHIDKMATSLGVSADYLLGKTDEVQLPLLPPVEGPIPATEAEKQTLQRLYGIIRDVLIADGDLKPGEPLTKEVKDKYLEIMLHHLEENYEDYKKKFKKD